MSRRSKDSRPKTATKRLSINGADPTVYILGAGASCFAGFPLASNLRCFLEAEVTKSKNIQTRQFGRESLQVIDTMEAYLAVLRRLYSLAVRDGKVDANPLQGVRLPKINNARTRYLTEEERRLFETLSDRL